MKTPGQPLPESGAETDIVARNRRFYDSLWSGARLVEPSRFNTWPLVRSLLPHAAQRLEIEGSQVVDISGPALAQLRARGANAVQGQVTALPFRDASFDLVCALDIIEHVEHEDAALAEISRVAKGGAAILISAPLHAAMWTSFDDFVGHKRRYEPLDLLATLAAHGLAIERSAVFGMAPRASRLVDLGMWWLLHDRRRALWWYNKAFMPLGLRFQKELQLMPGMVGTDGVDEVLLVCRRA